MARPPKLLELVTVSREKARKNKDGTVSVEYFEEQMRVFDAVVIGLRMGAYVEDAAKAAGVSDASVFKWMARGKEHAPSDDEAFKSDEERLESVPEEQRLYVEFSDAVEKARAEAVQVNLSIIRSAARSGNWQASAWWLERTRPRQFGRRQAVELSGEVKGTATGKLDLSKLSLDEARQLQSLLDKAKQEAVTA